jgi:hypothetical protein
MDKDLIVKDTIFHFHVDELLDITDPNFSRYNNIYNAIWNYIFNDPRRKDNFVRIFIGGTINNPTKFVNLTCAETLIHLTVWIFYVYYYNRYKLLITDEDFYDLSKFNGRLFSSIMDKTMNKFANIVEDTDELSYCASIIIDQIVELAEVYAPIAACTLSIYDIIQLMKRNKDFKDCINTQLEENITVKEVENLLETGKDKLMKAIMNDGKSNFVPYITSKRMTPEQFTQCFYAVGTRMDVDKTILPKLMRGNYLKGFQNASDYFMDGITARIGQLAKHSSIRISGYLSRKVSLLCLNTHIDPDVKDCGTKKYVDFYVENEDFLHVLDQKYQVLDDGSLKMINKDTDKHLIGETITIRTHIGCLLDKDRVCQTCFGGKAKKIASTRIGGLPSIVLFNVLSKKLLKMKHFTTTNSIEVSDNTIHKYFDIDSNKLYIKHGIDTKNLFIVIDREYIEDIIEGSVNIEDDSVDFSPPLEEITIRNNGEDILLECEGLFLILSDELMGESSKFIMDLDSEDVLIPINKLDVDNPLFNIVILTEEVSRYLSQTMKHVDSNLAKKYVNYDSFLHDLVKILVSAGVNSNIIHSETLVYQMVRDIDNLYRRPDFRDVNAPYIILPLKQAILKRDVYTSFAFQQIKDIFTDPDSYKKSAGGPFDTLFVTKRPKHLEKIDRQFIMNCVNK